MRLRLIVCGNPDRGDDGVAPLAITALLDGLPVVLRRRLDTLIRNELDVVDLLDVPPGTACIVADAAVGVDPGEVVCLSLGEVARRAQDGGPAPRSSHSLPVDQVLGLAARLDRLPEGLFVGVGGLEFGLGAALSEPVAAAVPAFQTAVVDAIEALLTAPPAGPAGAGRQVGTSPSIAVGSGGPTATLQAMSTSKTAASARREHARSTAMSNGGTR